MTYPEPHLCEPRLDPGDDLASAHGSIWNAEAAAERAQREVSNARQRGITRRQLLAGAAAAVPAAMLLGSGVASARSGATSRVAGRGSGPAALCALPPDVVAKIRRGWDPHRSSQLLYVPHGWNYLSAGISHNTPWHYTQDVPMFWYGPGIINPGKKPTRWVNLADVAPTVAKLVNFSFDAPDGAVMTEAIKPSHPKPKLVVVLVWDAGGRYVLNLHSQVTPNLKGLMSKGTWYTSATVGSSPSNTAPSHASIGTGAHPVQHGVVDNDIRYPDGKIRDVWAEGPGVLKVPTLADQYAMAHRTTARTAMLGTLTWHLGMVGQGANLPNGVKHIVLMRDQGNASTEAPKWEIRPSLAPYYTFPSYVNDPSICPPLSSFTHQYADAVDGKVDGTWRGHNIQATQGGFHTPARIPYQTRAIEKIIERENLGRHADPDLLFLNYKIIDEIGHEYFADSPEMTDVVKVQDEFLGKLVSFLDTVHNGALKGAWALCLTADHGHTSTPARTGGAQLLVSHIESQVEAQFDADGDGQALIQDVRPSGLMLSEAELQQNHVKLAGISNFLSKRTIGQIANPETVHAPNALAFDAVFSGDILPNLDCP